MQSVSVDVAAAVAPARGVSDERESLYNGRPQGPANRISVPVEQVAAINGFMIDVDLAILNPAVIGEAVVTSAESLYAAYVCNWLDRDPVLSKAEVRDTGHGLHVLLWLDSPIVVAEGQAGQWDSIARGIRNVLPGDPRVNGINVMTRPVGATNTKSEPVRTVRLLRAGKPVAVSEILDLNRRLAEHPAQTWMQVFYGGTRISPCPLCGGAGSSLGVAGNWQIRCYECGRIDSSILVYRFYKASFLAAMESSKW